MEASIVDLRYKMKDVLKALSRFERVKILYHGKVHGTIIPASAPSAKKVSEHVFFGMAGKGQASVQVEMSALRGGRYSAL